MKRKLIALTLAGMLALETAPMLQAAPAPEQDMSAQAEQVTRKVKETLSIGDEYDGFHSEYQKNGDSPRWILFWTGENDVSLTVEATTQGQVLEYRLYYPEEGRRYDSTFAPQQPKMSNSQADQVAKEFLDKVLVSGETVKLENAHRRRSGERIYYSFDVLLNGLPSPFSGHIQVDGNQGRVNNFWRSDSGSTTGSVPSAAPAVQAAQGQQTLRGGDKLQLEYAAGEKGEKAQLRYVPVSQDILVTDAQTGELLNLTELREKALEEGATFNSMKSEASADLAAPAAGADGGLSRAEQQGIEKLKDVLSVQQLDAKLQAMPELALNGFQLEDSAYSYDKEKDLYTCYLNYQKKEGEEFQNISLRVDAKTGQLQRFSSYGSQERKYLEREKAWDKAQAFLKNYFPQQAEAVAPYEGSSLYQGDGCLLVRQHQSIPYPENHYRLVFYPDGTLASFSSQWDQDAQFESPEGIVSQQAALEAWQQARPIQLAYVGVPCMQQGRYQEMLTLAYQYSEQAGQVYGVEAKTGKALIHEKQQEGEISYSDVTEKDKEILALAQLGIGYRTGTFEKKKQLTQAELLSFLVSANGDYYDPQDPEQLDALYENAYSLGILSRNQRQADAPVSRMQLIKILLDMSGYGKTAQIQGIFTCSFADAGAIAAEDYGYAAIAQGLGIVRGDGAGNLSPANQATREQMAIMFYNFMNRA